MVDEKLFEEFKEFSKKRFGIEVTKRETPNFDAFVELFGMDFNKLEECYETPENYEYIVGCDTTNKIDIEDFKKSEFISNTEILSIDGLTEGYCPTAELAVAA